MSGSGETVVVGNDAVAIVGEVECGCQVKCVEAAEIAWPELACEVEDCRCCRQVVDGVECICGGGGERVGDTEALAGSNSVRNNPLVTSLGELLATHSCIAAVSVSASTVISLTTAEVSKYQATSE
jgi:hypothetical protein